VGVIVGLGVLSRWGAGLPSTAESFRSVFVRCLVRETEEVVDSDSQRRRGLPFRQQLATWALGVAGGLAVNTLSNDVGYRGAAVVAAFAAILLSTNWLRQLPPGAPLARIASGALLGIAVIMVVAAVMNSRWEGLATIVATVLTTSAVLIQTDLDKAAGLLFGVAGIGVGVAVIGVGVAVLRHGGALGGVAGIGGGVALIGVGVAVLRHGDVLGGLALIGVGLALIGVGLAAIGFGVAVLRDSGVLFGVAVIGGGVALIGGGVAGLRHGGALGGLALIGVGLATIGFGVAVLRRIGLLSHALSWLVSLTKDPGGEALHNGDPALSVPDNPPPGLMDTPRSEPPRNT
jgi:hypothetical protein